MQFRLLLDPVSSFNGNLLIGSTNRQDWAFTIFSREHPHEIKIHDTNAQKKSKLGGVIAVLKSFLVDKKDFVHFFNEQANMHSHISCRKEKEGNYLFNLKACFRESINLLMNEGEMIHYLEQLVLGLAQIYEYKPISSIFKQKQFTTLENLEQTLGKMQEGFKLKKRGTESLCGNYSIGQGKVQFKIVHHPKRKKWKYCIEEEVENEVGNAQTTYYEEKLSIS